VKKWLIFGGALGVVLIVRSRSRQYSADELRNLLWDSEAGRWRSADEVKRFLREHPDRAPITILSSEARVLSYLSLIEANAKNQNLDPALVAAIIWTESRGDYAARGPVGEYGLMQVRDTTAQMLGFSGDPDTLLNPATNIRYGTQYLNWQLERYASTPDPVSFAVSAYNAGTAHFNKGVFANQKYVDSVIKYGLPRFRLLIDRAHGIYR
jgi:soluble lytic murein transglycosylase-like protein